MLQEGKEGGSALGRTQESQQRRKQTPQRFVPWVGPSCIQRYSPVKRLQWSGDLGDTCVASDSYRPGRLVLLKDVEVRERSFKAVEAGLRKHSELTHPHLVELLEAEAGRGVVKLVVEYPQEGSLFEYVCSQPGGGGLNEVLARWTFQQVVTAVEYCHSLLQPLGNVRAENVLLATGAVLPVVKLWGVVYSQAGGATRSKEELAQYRAPESVPCGLRVDSYAMDVWALGVLLHFMVSARYPMQAGKGGGHRQGKHKSWRPEFGPNGVSGPCRDLIGRCLQVNPTHRIKLQDMFEHEWFRENYPPEARDMNARILETNHMASSAKMPGVDLDISNIVLDACHKHSGDANNGLIDQIITEELGRESSLTAKSVKVSSAPPVPARFAGNGNMDTDAGG